MAIINLNTNFEPPVLDPISLEGLEPLLDKVFSAAPPPDARAFLQPIAPPLHSTTDSGELFGGDEEIISSGSSVSSDNADASLVINELCATIDLLRAQLAFSNSELRFAADRNRWLETQIATKEDQLRLMPDLITRAAQVTIAERELKEIQLDADRLLDETQDIKDIAAELSKTLNETLKDLEELNKPLWLRIWNWLLGRNSQ